MLHLCCGNSGSSFTGHVSDWLIDWLQIVEIRKTTGFLKLIFLIICIEVKNFHSFRSILYACKCFSKASICEESLNISISVRRKLSLYLQCFIYPCISANKIEGTLFTLCVETDLCSQAWASKRQLFLQTSWPLIGFLLQTLKHGPPSLDPVQLFTGSVFLFPKYLPHSVLPPNPPNPEASTFLHGGFTMESACNEVVRFGWLPLSSW